MELLQEVTRSRAPLIEYEHVAVYTDAVLEVLPDETVKVVLQCRIDEPECKYTFCGKSYTMADLEAALVMAAEVRNLPAYRAHRARPEQLRKFLLIAKKVSNRGFMWRDVLYPSLADLVNAIAPTLDAQVSMRAIWQVLCSMSSLMSMCDMLHAVCAFKMHYAL